MERIEILKQLRKPDIVFPSGWNDSDTRLSRKKQLIKWCLAHDPSQRAGPLELLRSDLLPPAVQDEYISDTLNHISQQPLT